MKNILTQEHIDQVCKQYEIKNYTINPDGFVDVDGIVDISSSKLSQIPLKFGIVSGSFYCNHSNLATLDGSPKIVGGSFYCNDNKLVNLIGSPQSVGGIFNCKSNYITSLEGSPLKVEGIFNCSYNSLSSFEYLPNVFEGVFWRHNKNMPQEFIDHIKKLDEAEIGIFFKYMKHYDVWKNGRLNDENMLDLIEDIEDGLR